jgi:preprotein translocase subunit SecD
MSTLSNLLQDADPLRHEPQRNDAARERVRQRVISGAVAERSGRARPSRRRAAALFAFSLGALTLGGMFWWRAATPLLAAVRVEIRLAESAPSPGLIVAKLPKSEALIYLHPETLVGNDDIQQSWVTDNGGGRFGVTVQLSQRAAERMRQGTANHMGRPLAILIDGAVTTAPVVRSPIGESAVVTGSFTRDEAERIVKGIGGR